MAAVSKTAGRAGAPAVQVAPVPVFPSAIASSASSASSSSGGSGGVAAAAKKWGAGEKPAAGKCGVYAALLPRPVCVCSASLSHFLWVCVWLSVGCTQAPLGRGFCAAHASFAVTAPKKTEAAPSASASASATASTSAAAAPAPAPAAAATAATPAPASPTAGSTSAPAFGAFGAPVVVKPADS
jgi:hypothetical protein